MQVALSHVGTREIPGADSNPKIVAWFEAAGAPWIRNDAAAWCSAFACGVTKEAGVFNPRTVRAREWLDLPPHGGTRIEFDDLLPGDVCVVSRGNNLFHVSFFEGRSRSTLRLVGGNQGNVVRIADYANSRFVGARRLNWAVSAPGRDSLVLA